MSEHPPRRVLCTDCGISRSAEPARCARACQFIAPDYPRLEKAAHGRARELSRGEERFFGPYLAMHRARLRAPLPDAQWSGITTRIAERLLETGGVSAVLCMRADAKDRW
ncbi:MAG: coenzyme F420 hydrogenase/dehydrogenase beta subunit N-terminal domain-containing protein, partial [Gammaproteobacteria bacterium]